MVLKGNAPLIAITPDAQTDVLHSSENSYVVRMNYASALAECGALPVILPYLPDDIATLLDRFDGFLISGTTPGISETPSRSDFERALIAAALDAGKPLLGICNGMQMLGVALGGYLGDIEGGHLDESSYHLPAAHPISAAHPINITPDSRISKLLGGDRTHVNSFHRQEIKLGGMMNVVAHAPDGVIEAIEAQAASYAVGVQWHPEYLLSDFDRAIIMDFVAAAGQQK
jgi:gamma-glutamyl-gamma-aminobutyrate hydrolase PuuD